MRPADPVTVVSAPAADLVVRDYEPKGAERRSSWSGEGADASATGYVDLDVVPLAYPGWSSHGASTGGKWQASVNVGAFPEGTSWLLVAGSGEDSSSWPLTVTDGMLRLPRISGDARLEWTLPASALTDDWERGATRTFDIQVIPDEDAFAASQIDINAEPGFDAVAVNTQIRTHLMLAPRQLKPKAGMSLTADDLWLPGEQRWEGDLQVTQGDVTLSQGVDYDIQWTASGEPSQAPRTAAACRSLTDGPTACRRTATRACGAYG